MKHIFLDRQSDGLALYLYGDLQFHESDEQKYHRSLAAYPVAVAAERFPGQSLRVLILGGGDGLALRDVLQNPHVDEVHLVDLDSEVLRLGQTDLATLNQNAFKDPRVHVHVENALDYIQQAKGFAVIINDFTFPRTSAGASLFEQTFFNRERAALVENGILAVNAMSPEKNARAFGCVASTLRSAGFTVDACACVLASFVREQYGTWGFLFASTKPLARPSLEEFSDATRIDLSEERFQAQPHLQSELLRYLYTHDNGSGTRALNPLGALGFANWLNADEGHRTLEGLLGALPVGQRGPARQSILDWGPHAEKLFHSADLKAFVDALLARAKQMPAAWVAELRQLKARLDQELPSMQELLSQAYRVFALFLIVLLLANMFYPDNSYAKGYGGGYGGGSGYGGGNPMVYSSYSGSPFHFRGSTIYGRTYDAYGRPYSSTQFTFSDPKQGTRQISSMLALTPNLQLLDSGAVAYTAPVEGFKFYVEPGLFRVFNTYGIEVLTLATPPDMENIIRTQISSQKLLVDKALPDHERWLRWTGWAVVLDDVKEDKLELENLKRIDHALDQAATIWSAAPLSSNFPIEKTWATIFPGVYLVPTPLTERPTLALVGPGQTIRKWTLPLGTPTTDEDLFLTALYNEFMTTRRIPSWS